MGSGTWSRASYADYSRTVGRSLTKDGDVSGDYKVQDMFKSRKLDPSLDPKDVIRECVDSEEHPNTFPVILGLDVTGSMGNAAMEVAKKLNNVMTELFGKIKDIEFMVMGIGDVAYDNAPIQVSQFESDIRIAEQLDKIYFEGGGGGNQFESYTAAWYIGSRCTKLDCLKRGKKGIIITMGDEPINPYLPSNIRYHVGDRVQDGIETDDLYPEVCEKFDVYHLIVAHGYRSDVIENECKQSWSKYLDEDHLITTNIDDISNSIVNIIVKAFGQENTQTSVNENVKEEENTNENTDGISW